MYEELYQEEYFSTKLSLIIDIENVFLTELNISNEDDVDIIKNIEDHEKRLIIINKYRKG